MQALQLKCVNPRLCGRNQMVLRRHLILIYGLVFVVGVVALVRFDTFEVFSSSCLVF